MMWTVFDLLKGCRGAVQGETNNKFKGVSIDSRTIDSNDLFIAIKGPRFDGHDFVEVVFKKGVMAAIVSHAAFQERRDRWRSYLKSHLFILVEDTLEALQSFATWHRERFQIPLIGITGSNGKTTTKEMTTAILEQQGTILKNKGNLNNHIGLPLSLLRLREDHTSAVLEMGISEKGEMEGLCAIAKPTVGVITNIGSAHLEGLGDLEGVGEEKGVLFQSVEKSGTAIINRDDPILEKWENRLSRKWTFGLDAEADVTASNIVEEGDGIRFKLRRNRSEDEVDGIRLPVPGKVQVLNALAAIAASSSLGVGLKEISRGLANFQPIALRTEILKKGGVTILVDAYNANPDSVKAALHLLSSYPIEKGSRIAILGEMLELGRFRESAHFEIGMETSRMGIDRLIALGESAETVAAGARKGGMPEEAVSTHRDLASIVTSLGKIVKKGDTLLIKGSRLMRMEALLEDLSDVL